MVSIVVLNHNGKKFLKQCFSSILRTEYPYFEVILVDNASTDGSANYIREKYGELPNVKIVCNKANLGSSGGYNVGARISKGDYIVFIHGDIQVKHDWLKELVGVMNSDFTIGSATGKKLSLQNPEIIDGTGGFLDRFGLACRRGRGERDRGQYEKVDDIFYVHLTMMAFKRHVLNEIGLLDEKFFFQSDDIDLGWRLRLRGYRAVYVPSSVVLHLGGSGRGGKLLGSFYLNIFCANKNRIAIALKNYEIHNLIKYLFLYLLLIFGYSLYKGVKMKDGVFFWNACIKAIAWNLLNLRYLFKERIIIQRYIRRVPDKELFKTFLPYSCHLLNFIRKNKR